MDPNETLREIRELLAIGASRISQDDLFRLAELVGSLDQWISSGGFLPSAWTPFETAAREYSRAELALAERIDPSAADYSADEDGDS